jgi:hypothetical protein
MVALVAAASTALPLNTDMTAKNAEHSGTQRVGATAALR